MKPPPPTPRPSEANGIWKYQIKWNHFHHMGPEYVFSLFLRPYYFLVPLLSHFIFFLHTKNQNIFLDKNPARPRPPHPPPQITKWSVPHAICEQQRHRSACASAHSDQHLCCSLPRQYNISSIYIGNFMALASFFS